MKNFDFRAVQWRTTAFAIRRICLDSMYTGEPTGMGSGARTKAPALLMFMPRASAYLACPRESCQDTMTGEAIGDRMYSRSSSRPAVAADARSDGGSWPTLKRERNDKSIGNCSIAPVCGASVL